jgi:serine/threonine protein kinase, bacterial
MTHRIVLQSGCEPLPGFRLDQMIGKGGFAEVWEAHHQNHKVALKFILSSNTTTTVKEIKSLSAIQKIDHPGLLQMDRISSIPGYIVISMELAEGSLFDLFEAFQTEYHAPIELKILLNYMSQLADTLDFLNKRQHVFEGRIAGFQHCDIKPSNLLLFGDIVKLADFGLCSATYAPLNPVLRMGTVDFAAPEVHRNILSEKSDQYSLAVTYYYLRTGRFPFPPVDNNRFNRVHSYQRPLPDLSLVPGQEEEILARALDLTPERRWPDCVTMVSKIRAIHGFGTSVPFGNSATGEMKSSPKAVASPA